MRVYVQRLRLEYEQTIKDLIQEHHEQQAGQDAKLTALRQELAQAFKKHADTTTPLRQKLEESLALHATTLEQLSRIHDDKLHCLELELQAAKAEQLGRADVADQEVQERYRLDLEDIKRTHQQEVEQLLKEHQEEVAAVNANFEVLKNQATEEYEVRFVQDENRCLRYRSEFWRLTLCLSSSFLGRVAETIRFGIGTDQCFACVSARRPKEH